MRVSTPKPPVKMSLPAPPFRISLPAPPSRISLPAPPLRMSLPVVPLVNKSLLVFKFGSKPPVPELKSMTVTGISLSVTFVSPLLPSNVVAETLSLNVPV